MRKVYLIQQEYEVDYALSSARKAIDKITRLTDSNYLMACSMTDWENIPVSASLLQKAIKENNVIRFYEGEGSRDWDYKLTLIEVE